MPDMRAKARWRRAQLIIRFLDNWRNISITLITYSGACSQRLKIRFTRTDADWDGRPIARKSGLLSRRLRAQQWGMRSRMWRQVARMDPLETGLPLQSH